MEQEDKILYWIVEVIGQAEHRRNHILKDNGVNSGKQYRQKRSGGQNTDIIRGAWEDGDGWYIYDNVEA